jgi:deoxyribonuclease-1-like protein
LNNLDYTDNKPVTIILIFLCFIGTLSAQTKPPNEISIKVCSWNLKDFGISKSNETIMFIAETLRDYDIILIQEVVAGYGGPQAVARLSDELNRKGAKWEYQVSNPTKSSAYKAERYAALWKPSKVKKIGKSWLEETFQTEIDREPFYSTFSIDSKEFTLVNFHAITKSKQPETEVKYFKFLPAQYPNLKLIFCGDFNLPENHSVFNPLKKMGYIPALTRQKTSLKMTALHGQNLASEFDNFFYFSGKVVKRTSGVVHFYQAFSDLANARKISDHIPIFFEFSILN